jgi:microcompartment protein CcmK/EutM
VFALGSIVFLVCILLITLFQTKANRFYLKFLNPNNSSSNETKYDDDDDEEYYTAGTRLVKQTILMCNGPYFSYQVNNLVVLPFSLLLGLVFSFFKPQQRSNMRQRSVLPTTSCSTRPSLQANVNPFQRRNRFLIAALFCILANEIFKMIESSMFVISNNKSQAFNTTNELLSSFVDFKAHHNDSSAVELSKIGFGIEPNVLLFKTSTKQQQLARSKPAAAYLHMIPSVISYTKPKLRPRLEPADFSTTESTNHLITVNLNLDKLKTVKNKSINLLGQVNRTLQTANDKTLFEATMSLYHNEYVQALMKNLLTTSSDLNWSLILDKFEKILLMLVEVFVIGMRYYPLMGVIESDSFVCLLLAAVYMWADIAYNIAITGLCEGLRLNVSFDLLKDIRHLFGVGFLLPAKQQPSSQPSTTDFRFLFSQNRILYTIVKSLPHFFSLSYVTVRFSLACALKVTSFISNQIEKRQKAKLPGSALNAQQKTINTKLKISNRIYDLVYTTQESKARRSHRDESHHQLSFEDRYVRNRLRTRRTAKIPNKSEIFRFSTRIVCTYTVCFTVLYYLTCFFTFYGFVFVEMIYFPVVYKQTILLSAVLTSLTCCVQLCLSLRQFRSHLIGLYQGKSGREFGLSPRSFLSNKKIATSSFNYAGFAVTYTCWGYVILFGLVTFILVQLATLIAFGASTSLALFLVILLVPFMVSIFLMRLLNHLVSSMAVKFCFLQKKSQVLALKNFKCYSLFLYFKFFYDCFTGIAFCFFRAIKLLVFGTLYLTRLDYSFMGGTCEKMDQAFMSYVGYLYWEAQHTNPIAISFCDMLQRELRLRVIRREQLFLARGTAARARWHVAYTLIKNKSLINFRKQKKIPT